MKISCSNFSTYWLCVFTFITSIEVGQIFGKRPSVGLIPDLPPIHPNSPRPGHLSSGQPRRTSTQSSVPGNSVPSSPILGNRARGFSPARDQRLFIASFCRLDDMNWDITMKQEYWYIIVFLTVNQKKKLIRNKLRRHNGKNPSINQPFH